VSTTFSGVRLARLKCAVSFASLKHPICESAIRVCICSLLCALSAGMEFVVMVAIND
jgi:hypothetical protein